MGCPVRILDPDGFPAPDPHAPTSTAGKVAAILGAALLAGLVCGGICWLGIKLWHALGLMP